MCLEEIWEHIQIPYVDMWNGRNCICGDTRNVLCNSKNHRGGGHGWRTTGCSGTSDSPDTIINYNLQNQNEITGVRHNGVCGVVCDHVVHIYTVGYQRNTKTFYHNGLDQ